jgi:hypothetical protein
MATQRTAKKARAVRKLTKAAKKPARRVQRVARTSAVRTPARVTTIDDHEGVRQVLTRYCYALDQGKFDDVGALFHREASFSVSFDGQKHTGRETIQAWYERFFRERPGEFRHMRHKIFEPMITITGATAVSSTYFDADSVENGTIRMTVGRYDDTLVKEGGQWFFKERTITVFYRYSLGNPQEW